MPIRAADTFRWRGNGAGTKSALNDGRNWVDATGAAHIQDHYPFYDAEGAHAGNVDGDSVLFDAAITAPALALAGYDASALGDGAALKVLSAYNTTIASSGAKLLFDMQVAGQVIVDAENAGDMYLKGAGANGIGLVQVINTKGGSTPSVLYLDGDIDRLRALKGKINLQATCVISTELNIGYLTARNSDVNLTITAGATLPAIIDMSGGTITNNVAITTLRMSDGLWTNAAGAITTAKLTGGHFYWNEGAIATAYVEGIAYLDGSGSVTPRTLALCYLGANGRLNINNGAQSINVTALRILGERPEIQWTPGQVIAIAAV